MNPQPKRSTAYTSTPSLERAGPNRRYSRQEESKPGISRMGGRLDRVGEAHLVYEIPTSPLRLMDVGTGTRMRFICEAAAIQSGSDMEKSPEGLGGVKVGSCFTDAGGDADLGGEKKEDTWRFVVDLL